VRRTRIFLAVTVVVFLVAGCNGDDEGGGSTTTTAAGVTTTVAGGVTTVPGATTVVPADTTTTAPAAAALVLRADGLGLVEFGDSKDATISAISTVLGALDETGTGCELAGTDVTTARWKELRVQFVGATFDSYGVRPPNGVAPVLGLETEAGIGLGSTVAQLQTAYGAALAIPGLPPMFGADNFAISFPGIERKLRGSLTGTDAASTVTGFFTQVCE